MRIRSLYSLILPALAALPAMAHAVAPNLHGAPSQAPATQAQIAALQQAVDHAQMAGDNAWMLVSAALVLLMTGPGLALFYGGLVRRKNILGTMMQSFAMMGLITILWAIAGYSLAFGHGNAFIGGFEHLFLRGVSLSPNPDYAATIPEQTFMVYQLMFAIITPALITGAFAERVKFSSMAVFLCLWSLVVYCPMAHMIWGVGGLLNFNNSGARWPVLDFAGGTVVHITSGVSALVTCLYLGKRIGYPDTDMPPHSMVLSFIGACLLWVGWFGFNAGSALSAGPLATSAFINTQFAAAAAALTWTLAEWIQQRQADGIGRNFRRGRRAGYHYPGLRICAAHVGPGDRRHRRPGLLLHGLQDQEVLRLRRFARRIWRARGRRHRGRAADRRASPRARSTRSLARTRAGKPRPTGAIDGNWHQILNQAVGVGIGWLLAIVGTLVLLFVVDKVMGLRVSPERGSRRPRPLAARRGRLRVQRLMSTRTAALRADTGPRRAYCSNEESANGQD